MHLEIRQRPGWYATIITVHRSRRQIVNSPTPRADKMKVADRKKQIEFFEEFYIIKGDGVAELKLEKAKKDPKFRESVRQLTSFREKLSEAKQA
jgi:hypothetical protein